MNGDDVKHIIITLAAFSGIFGIFYVFMMTRYKERMAMIEHGVNASIFTGDQSISPTLKFGMLFIGISIGIIIANIMHDVYGFSMGWTMISMIFLFGGVSLVLNFIIERRLEKKTDS